MHRTTVRALRTTYQTTIRGLSSRTSGTAALSATYRGRVVGAGRLLSGGRASATGETAAATSGGRSGTSSNKNRSSATVTSGRSHLIHTSAPVRNLHKYVVASILPLTTPTMYFRRFSLAIASSLVGYGAWYAYNGTESTAGFHKLRADAPDHVPTRNVLVIGPDGRLHTGSVEGEGPIAMDLGGGKKVVEMLNEQQVDDKLRKMQESYFVNRGQGVVRYDVAQLPSNNPIEDDHAEHIVQVPVTGNGDETNDWMFWGVFDGHSGWSTSSKLRQSLIQSVATELNNTYKAAGGLTPANDVVEAAIKAGFTKLDDEIVHRSVDKVLKQKSKTLAAEMLSPALAGSCALLSFYDSREKVLRVACTGDSRAVLGRRSESASGKKTTWTATALSADQTGSNPDEARRMRALHPDEPNVIRNGRVLGGLEPTRAFGDAQYKWSRDVADRLRRNFFARSQPSTLKTPPYVTAEPVVTTTRGIRPDRGDFLVLATDGLWEMLTNDEVVGLVGKWLETNNRRPESGGRSSSSSSSQLDFVWKTIFGSSGGAAGLPVEHTGPVPDGSDGAKTPQRIEQWGVDPTGDRFVVQDSNVATHLVRNALGGKNKDQLTALLTLQSPFSRRYRDDLTVQVIFFGEGEKTGAVTLNLDASYVPTEEPKAKL